MSSSLTPPSSSGRNNRLSSSPTSSIFSRLTIKNGSSSKKSEDSPIQKRLNSASRVQHIAWMLEQIIVPALTHEKTIYNTEWSFTQNVLKRFPQPEREILELICPICTSDAYRKSKFPDHYPELKDYPDLKFRNEEATQDNVKNGTLQFLATGLLSQFYDKEKITRSWIAGIVSSFLEQAAGLEVKMQKPKKKDGNEVGLYRLIAVAAGCPSKAQEEQLKVAAKQGLTVLFGAISDIESRQQQLYEEGKDKVAVHAETYPHLIEQRGRNVVMKATSGSPQKTFVIAHGTGAFIEAYYPEEIRPEAAHYNITQDCTFLSDNQNTQKTLFTNHNMYYVSNGHVPDEKPSFILNFGRTLQEKFGLLPISRMTDNYYNAIKNAAELGQPLVLHGTSRGCTQILYALTKLIKDGEEMPNIAEIYLDSPVLGLEQSISSQTSAQQMTIKAALKLDGKDPADYDTLEALAALEQAINERVERELFLPEGRKFTRETIPIIQVTKTPCDRVAGGLPYRFTEYDVEDDDDSEIKKNIRAKIQACKNANDKLIAAFKKFDPSEDKNLRVEVHIAQGVSRFNHNAAYFTEHPVLAALPEETEV